MPHDQLRMHFLHDALRALADSEAGAAASQEMWQSLVSRLSKVVGDDSILLYLSAHRQELRLLAHHLRDDGPTGVDADRIQSEANQTDGVFWQVMRSGLPVSVSCQESQPSPGWTLPSVWGGNAYNGLIAVPLSAHSRTIGVLATLRRSPTGHSQGDQNFLLAVADAMALRLANTELQVRLAEVEDEFNQEIGERTSAEEILARQAARLQEQADLLDLTYDAILVRDVEARILFWNRGAEERYGWRAEEVLGQNAHHLLQAVFPQPVEAIYERLFRLGRWEGQLVYTTRKGERVIVFSQWALQRDDRGYPATVLEISSDITEIKAKEHALAQQGERLQVLHEIDRAILAAQSPAGIARAAVRRIRQLIPCQRAAVILFDYEIGQARWLAMDAEGQDQVASPYRLSLDEFPNLQQLGEGSPTIVDSLALIRNPTQGEQFLLAGGILSYAALPLLANVQLIGVLTLGLDTPGHLSSEDLAVAAQVADSLAVAMQNAQLNEQVRVSRQQLHDLSRRLAELQEHERRYVANELYDDAGQRLAALLLQLRLFEENPELGSSVRAQVGEMKRLAIDLLADLHSLAVNLRPASLDKLGLVPALRQYAEQLGEQYGLKTEVYAIWPDNYRLPQEVETPLYRVLQEAMINVVHHARARTLGVVLRYSDHKVTSVVEDDGIGFVPQEARQQGSLGLFGMRQRIEDLGGVLTIESEPGHGTAVHVELPAP